MEGEAKRDAMSAAAVAVAADGHAVDRELERRWASVEGGLRAVLRALEGEGDGLRTEPEHWVRMYTDVAKLYNQDDTQRKRRMFVHVRAFIREFVVSQESSLKALVGTELLAEYVRRWRMSLLFVRFMKRVLHHMNKGWISANANSSKEDPVRPLDRLLMFYWREELLSNLHGTIDVVLQLIDDDRRGKVIDHAVVRGVVDNLVTLGGADSRVCEPEPRTRSRSIDDGMSPAASRRDDGLTELHLYVQVFEEEFLQRTRLFYRAEAEKMMRGSDISTFMRNVVSRLEEECARGLRLLHKESAPRLRATVEEQLVGAHLPYLQQEAGVMVREGREADLRMLHKLLQRLDGALNPVRDHLVSFVKSEGTQIMRGHIEALAGKSDMKRTIAFVEDLLRLHKDRVDMVKRCFNGAQIFIVGIDDAFRVFINRSMGSTFSMPEVLAYFADHLLRGNGAATASTLLSGAPNNTANIYQDQDQNQDQISRYMDLVVRLFMYLDDKDVFFESYRRLLAKRLLSNHDSDLEAEFIAKLKVEMGTTFTQRLSGMLADISLTKVTRERFSADVAKERSFIEAAKSVASPALEEPESATSDEVLALATDFNAHVLNALHWPKVQVDELRVPSVLQLCQERFKAFYMRETKSRTLTWIHSLSSVHLWANLGCQRYTLIMSTFQACALLLFNNADTLSLTEMSASLNVDAAELRRHLQPLVVSKKYRLLIRGGTSSADKLHATGTEKSGASDSWKSHASKAQNPSVSGVEKSSASDARKRPSLSDALFARRGANAQHEDKSGTHTGECPDDVLGDGFRGQVAGVGTSTALGMEDSEGSNKKSTATSVAVLSADSAVVFDLNKNFSSKQLRLSIPASMTRMTSKETIVTRRNVIVDRSMQVDAALVRIMKARKRMTHSELVGEVISQLAPTFKPDPKLIKLRVERLIDQEYIERDTEDARLYTFCA